MVRALIAAGADQNLTMSAKNIVMHQCASEGRTDIIAALIDEGGDVFAKNGAGKTPLTMAEQKG